MAEAARPQGGVHGYGRQGGGLVICNDKGRLDRKAAEKKLRSALRHNFYLAYREWPYKAVRPRIICEKYMCPLKDYKWFCFDGAPLLMFIASDRDREDVETKFDFYDADFTHLPFTNGHPNSEYDLPRPEGWDRMKEIATLLSKGLKHVRADLYELDGKYISANTRSITGSVSSLSHRKSGTGRSAIC